jgi:protein-S-isoprenylcysteine O-methyltransferase Ste14
MFLIAALTVRFQWPKNPFIIEVVGFMGIVLTFIIIFLVMRENLYASKRIEVQEGQKAISTGPYTYVRHPMYVGFIFMSLLFPIALGSLLAIPSGILAIILMAIRTYYEEKTLINELDSYEEYMQ